MKKIILLCLFMNGCLAFGQYHIRVNCFYKLGKDYDQYFINYTNDNWKTKHPLMEAFDISGDLNPFDICYQEKLFQSMYTAKQEAISFAKWFTTYKKCRDYNTEAHNLYLRLLSYRKRHPIRKSVEVVDKNYKCCTTTKIY